MIDNKPIIPLLTNVDYFDNLPSPSSYDNRVFAVIKNKWFKPQERGEYIAKNGKWVKTKNGICLKKWNMIKTYKIDQRVIHKKYIYQSLTDGNIANKPTLKSEFWSRYL